MGGEYNWRVGETEGETLSIASLLNIQRNNCMWKYATLSLERYFVK